MSGTNMHSAEAVETSEKAVPDRRLYLTLVERYHARVYDYLCWLCRDERLAEDLTAETFLRLWQHPPNATKRGSLKAYLFKVALNQYRQHLRSRGADLVAIEDTGASLADPADEPPVALERGALRRGVREAVEKLPDIHRGVVLLHSLEGLTLAEVAEALDIPIGTAKSRLAAAFAMLRRSLREWKEDEDELR
jgi:RNA polymerase sigma-70 factor (ECF subfamily)